MKHAAVKALATFGSNEAIAALQKQVATNDLSLRYQVVHELAETLHQPMQPDWLLPILMGRGFSPEWMDSLRLMRLYGGDRAIPSLLSCLDFTVGWSWRNWWLLETVKSCPKPPAIDYTHNPNREGQPDEVARNLRTLEALKALAGPISVPLPQPQPAPVPYLKTDPPIDFKPTIKQVQGHTEITSGFLKVSLTRTSSSTPYSPSEPYQPIYQLAQHIRWLLRFRDLYPALQITPEQNEQLSKLPLPMEWPFNMRWTSLFIDYKESPDGPPKQQAERALLDSVRETSQNYHAGVVGLAEAAKKILTPAQLQRLPPLVEKRRQAPRPPAAPIP